MTVSAGSTKTTQACNGTLVSFDFGFAIYKEEDITVIIKHIATEAETVLVLNADYVVTSDSFADGGTVSTFKEIDGEIVAYAWAADYSITIMLSLALVQETDLLYGGSFSSEAIELTVDRLTLMVQQLDEKINRTLKLRKTSSLNNIEIDDLKAGRFVIVNADADALEMGTVAGEVGQSPISNDPYDKTAWAGITDIAPSKNVMRNELANNRFTKGSTYAMIFALNSGDFGILPISNNAYGASWENQFNITPSQNALFDKFETIGAGDGDVKGPDTNSDNYVPQWAGADTKVLIDGFAITATGKDLVGGATAAAMRTTLGLGSAALRAAENILTDGSNIPDGHAIKIHGDANWGGAVSGPDVSIDNCVPTFDGTTGKILQDTTRLIEDTLTDGSNLPDGAAIKAYGDANWGAGAGYTNLTQFVAQTAWRLFYSNTDGETVELALGTSGQFLKANGDAAAPTWSVPSGAGDMLGPATNTDDYVPQWNGANSKTLKNGFAITAAGKGLIDDANVAAMRTTLELNSAALRTAEDSMTDGSNLPDGHAVKEYGDANWGGAGAGDVVGPAAHAASYVPQWNTTPNSKTLIDGFLITQVGKNFLDDATTAAQRSTLGLDSAALRAAEDTLTDGSSLPDGHAVKVYGDTNWGDAGTTMTIVAMGQSNMVGYGSGGGDTVTDSRVTAWNGSSWVLANLNNSPFASNHNNIAFHFAKQIARKRNCNVRIILEAENGRPISDWVPASATHYVGMKNQISASSTTKVDVVLWHQGESDSTRSYADYGADLNSLCTQLRGETAISKTVPIIMGELVDGGALDKQNYVYDRIFDYVSDSFVSVAEAKYLPHMGSNLHFTGDSLVVLGRLRYYTAMETMTGKAAGGDGGSTKEFFIPATSTDGDSGTHKGAYDTKYLQGVGHSAYTTFCVPHDYISTVEAKIVVIPTCTTSSAQWTLYTNYAQPGQSYGAHSHSYVGSYTCSSNQMSEVNVVSLLPNITANDMVGVEFKLVNPLDSVHVLGVRFKYA
jgi:hypothetical protein